MEKYYPRIDNGIFQLNNTTAYRVANISYIAIEGLIIHIFMIGMKQPFTISTKDEKTVYTIYDGIVAEMCGTFNSHSNRNERIS